MNTLSYFIVYLTKVILLSALLFSYYRLWLKDKPFHQFNRFFLLAIPLLSLTLPFIHLPFGGYLWPASQDTPTLTNTAHIITEGSWQETDTPTGPSHHHSYFTGWTTLAVIAYALTASILGWFFIRQLRYIRSLTKRYPREKLGNIYLFDTNLPDAPFSFLNRIFWNDQLDRNTPLGKQIFRHEQNHVRQKHSLDLLLLRPLTTLCWVNPFFHLIGKEIKAIHEFLADHDAIVEGDRFQYAERLVWHSVRNPAASLLHPFIQSPIKRRITMITQTKTIRTSLLSRAMLLPLLFLLFCAFAAKRQPAPTVQTPNKAAPYTVVIDAGHGGIDSGAITKAGIQEKDINLAVAEKIKQLSDQYNIRVIMTRDNDVLAGNKSSIRESLEYRAQLANENKADLFIAIHTDMQPSAYVKGFNIYVAENNAHYAQCVQLGDDLTSSLKKTYTTDVALKKRKEHIYVLRNTNMPAVLLSFGNMNNEEDLAFIRSEENQQKVAKDILEGVRTYADSH